MELLIIGGSRFVGRHLVSTALARNHQVTLFNRGKHTAGHEPHVEPIQGDRNQDLAKLAGRRWDAVIDTCGFFPRSVAASAQLLADSVDVYTFLSSVSVYADVSVCGVDESGPLKTLTIEQLDRAGKIESSGDFSAAALGDLYGGLKALCEQAAEKVMPQRVLNVRSGLIVGPYDYTDRFTYWVVRVAEGGEVLAPGAPDRAVQFIDARDLAEWTIRMLERKGTGVYNVTTKPNTWTMQDILQEAKGVSDSDARFTWVDEKFLLDENVAAWSEMPLWLPEDAAPHLKGFMFINSDKAIGDDLTFRSLGETISDTLTWYQKHQADTKLKAGIDRDREHDLLQRFHARHKAVS
jgi:nucleoside-diphosphate-sugar epimerase